MCYLKISDQQHQWGKKTKVFGEQRPTEEPEQEPALAGSLKDTSPAGLVFSQRSPVFAFTTV